MSYDNRLRSRVIEGSNANEKGPALYKTVRRQLTSFENSSSAGRAPFQVHKSRGKLPGEIAKDVSVKERVENWPNKHLANAPDLGKEISDKSAIGLADIKKMVGESCEYLGERMGKILDEHENLVLQAVNKKPLAFSDSDPEKMLPDLAELFSGLAEMLKPEHNRHSLELMAAHHWLSALETYWMNYSEEEKKAYSPLLLDCGDDDGESSDLMKFFKKVGADQIADYHPGETIDRRARHFEYIIKQKVGNEKVLPESNTYDFSAELSIVDLYKILDEIDEGKDTKLQIPKKKLHHQRFEANSNS